MLTSECRLSEAEGLQITMQSDMITVCSSYLISSTDLVRYILLSSNCLEITVGHHLWKSVFEYNFQL